MGGGWLGRAGQEGRNIDKQSLFRKHKRESQQVAGEYGGQMDKLSEGIESDYTTAGDEGAKKFTTARGELDTGYGTYDPNNAAKSTGAMGTAQKGFQSARDLTGTGYKSARNELKTGGEEAIGTAKSGYAKAQSFFDTPEMLTSRAQLAKMANDMGGYSAETINQMKGNTIEEAGTALRGAARASRMMGDSGARGLSGENMMRARSDISAQRAKGTREIDIKAAEAKRTDKLAGIEGLNREAYQRAGLSADEAKTVSGLQYKLASDTASLTAQETNALSQLAAAEGTTLADLQTKLASGKAQLTSDEAKFLADLTVGKSNAQATIGSAKAGTQAQINMPQKNTFQQTFW